MFTVKFFCDFMKDWYVLTTTPSREDAVKIASGHHDRYELHIVVTTRIDYKDCNGTHHDVLVTSDMWDTSDYGYMERHYDDLYARAEYIVEGE